MNNLEITILLLVHFTIPVLLTIGLEWPVVYLLLRKYRPEKFFVKVAAVNAITNLTLNLILFLLALFCKINEGTAIYTAVVAVGEISVIIAESFMYESAFFDTERSQPDAEDLQSMEEEMHIIAGRTSGDNGAMRENLEKHGKRDFWKRCLLTSAAANIFSVLAGGLLQKLAITPVLELLMGR